jgi:hypothetical protein
MKDNYSKEIEIFSDEQKAKVERERLARIEAQNRINQKRIEAQNRREENEWNPDEISHGSEGAHAWALLTYLLSTTSLEEKQPEDEQRIEFIDSELERLSELQSQYEAEGRDLTDIDADISAYEEEKEKIENRIDVYDMIPEHSNWGMSVFSVSHPDYEGSEWTVGDNDQIDNAAYAYERELVRDTGFDGFNKNYIRNFIDADAVANEARESYNQWVYDEPSAYLDEKEDRLLSKSQEKEIKEYQEKIDKYKSFIEKATERQESYDPDSSQWKALEKGIDKLNDLITDLEYDIENIKDEPDGDWDEDKIEEKINELVDDVENDPLYWLEEMGIEDLSPYIDEDEVIKDIVDSNGYYDILNGYNGDGDTIDWDNETYHIMQTNG